jgi:para-nitrobenzyl esterase
MVRRPTSAFCVARAAAGGENTWNFMFAFETWYKGGWMSTHADELAFIFHNTEYIGAMYAGESTKKMQDLIFNAWISFARTGDPNYEGMPEWKRVTPDERSCFVFSSSPGNRVAFDEKLVELVRKYRASGFGAPPISKKND